jgi:putative FmdB family regulatory protein
MPLYEYSCESCGRRTEALQRVSDPPLAVCPHCGGKLRKLISAPAFQFKGSGWYQTDYARKPERGAKGDGASGGTSGAAESAAGEKGAGGGETSKSETRKPAADAGGSKPTTGG